MGDGNPFKIFLVWCLGFVAGFSSGVVQGPALIFDPDSIVPETKPAEIETKKTCPPCPESKQASEDDPLLLDLFMTDLKGRMQDPIFNKRGTMDHNSRKDLHVALTKAICTAKRSGPQIVPRKRVPGMNKIVSGLARLDKADFASVIDTGVPLGQSRNLESDVLVLFGDEWSLPHNTTYRERALYAPDGSSSEKMPHPEPYMPTNDALQNCDQLAVITVKQERIGSRCFALLPGEESFHIQKWLRVANRKDERVNRKEPFRLVSRGFDPGKGVENPPLPSNEMAIAHRNWLGKFMSKVDILIEEVKPLAQKVAVNNQLIIMAVNDGQSELFMNFACAAQSRGFNVSNILVFIMDEGLKEVVEGLGMTAYYNEEFLGSLPSSDPNTFGDNIFTNVVISKFLCTYLMSILGYDFLFQDVDLVWYKDPMEFFNDPKLANPSFDIYFQDDINEGIRYQPYRGNSGFYYVRHNERTTAALKDAVLKTDQLFAARSHQQTLLEVLSEHVTYHGLRVKVYDGYDTEFFPLGHHFARDKAFMQAFFRGEKNSWIFHMNWTKKKSQKIAYFRQMGEWFVNDNCTNFQDARDKAASVGGSMMEACCSAEALFSCHYRDKPSKYPCKDSPTFDGNDARSWW